MAQLTMRPCVISWLWLAQERDLLPNQWISIQAYLWFSKMCCTTRRCVAKLVSISRISKSDDGLFLWVIDLVQSVQLVTRLRHWPQNAKWYSTTSRNSKIETGTLVFVSSLPMTIDHHDTTIWVIVNRFTKCTNFIRLG